jgi:hypothetical protein
MPQVSRNQTPRWALPRRLLATENHMKKLEQQPEAVQAYFQDPKVKYAA